MKLDGTHPHRVGKEAVTAPGKKKKKRKAESGETQSQDERGIQQESKPKLSGSRRRLYYKQCLYPGTAPRSGGARFTARRWQRRLTQYLPVSVTSCQREQSSLLFINVIGNLAWVFFRICLIKCKSQKAETSRSASSCSQQSFRCWINIKQQSSNKRLAFSTGLLQLK